MTWTLGRIKAHQREVAEFKNHLITGAREYASLIGHDWDDYNKRRYAGGLPSYSSDIEYDTGKRDHGDPVAPSYKLSWAVRCEGWNSIVVPEFVLYDDNWKIAVQHRLDAEACNKAARAEIAAKEKEAEERRELERLKEKYKE